MTSRSLIAVLCLMLVAPWSVAALGASPSSPKSGVRDLTQIRSSQVLRVLVNQSRNSSALIKGERVGTESQRLHALERFLTDTGSGRTLRLQMIPKAKGQLIAALLRGEGDLVAPGELLSVPRSAAITASDPVLKSVPLVLVGHKGQRRYQRVEQLAGKTLALPAGSAAGEVIVALNQRLVARRLAPVSIEWADPSLAVEDVLEMVQAGIYPLTVVEQPIAERWARVWPSLRIDRRVPLGSPAHLNWYMRTDAPQLKASIDRFLAGYRTPANADLSLIKAYKGQAMLHYPLASADRSRLEQLRPALQRHAREQQMDWLNLAALAFKESRLNPSARGASGATGLLQITPAAARRVGVGSIRSVDDNVQAAARYLALIRRQFFSSPRLNERERMAFTLAGYAMGPERVQAMRNEARRQGLNPDQWFFQTERIALEQVGMGGVRHVNTVNKYYLALERERSSLEQRPRSKAVSR